MLINKKIVSVLIFALLLISCKDKIELSSNPQQELASILMGSLFSFFTGLIVGGIATKLLTSKSKRRESRRSSDNEKNTDSYFSSLVDRRDYEIQQLKSQIENHKKMLNDQKEENNLLSKENANLREDLEKTKQLANRSVQNPESTEILHPENTKLDSELNVKYSKFADEKSIFPFTHLISNNDGSCYYRLVIDENEKIAQFEPVISELSIHSFKNNKAMLLFPYCEIVNYNENWSGIKVLTKGNLKFSSTEWALETKCKIELI